MAAAPAAEDFSHTPFGFSKYMSMDVEDLDSDSCKTPQTCTNSSESLQAPRRARSPAAGTGRATAEQAAGHRQRRREAPVTG